jgi:hypothetical protein
MDPKARKALTWLGIWDWVPRAATQLGCECRGDIGSIHYACAIKWLNSRKKLTCEICNCFCYGIDSNHLISAFELSLTDVNMMNDGEKKVAECCDCESKQNCMPQVSHLPASYCLSLLQWRFAFARKLYELGSSKCKTIASRQMRNSWHTILLGFTIVATPQPPSHHHSSYWYRSMKVQMPR